MKPGISGVWVIGPLTAAAALVAAVIALRAPVGAPDLVVGSVAIPKPLPPALRAGASVSVDVSYAEIAGAALDAGAAFDLVVYLSTDPRIEAGDVAVGRVRIEDGVAPADVVQIILRLLNLDHLHDLERDGHLAALAVAGVPCWVGFGFSDV